MKLSDYRTLGRSGLRVSPLAFGGGALGTKPDEVCRDLLKTYLDRGGNFIDTAEIYGFFGKSESWLGANLKDFAKRDNVVIGTKFGPNTARVSANDGGNGRKNLVRALDGSLQRLKTDFIDIYWIHVWDAVTPVEEVVDTMDLQIKAGKIRYCGLSNVPAWYAALACSVASRTSSPIALQMQYSLIERTIDYEHLPMAQELGLGVCAYSPLGDGFLSGKYKRTNSSFEGEGRLEDHRRANFAFARRLADRDWNVLSSVVDVARELAVPPAQVALNWVANRPGITSTLVAASKVPQLRENLDALELEIPAPQGCRLDQDSAPDAKYPYNMFEPAFRRLLEQDLAVRAWARVAH